MLTNYMGYYTWSHDYYYNGMQKCANSTSNRRCPEGCLGDGALLWKANNYPCHTINDSYRRQHDSPKAWLCQYCASPGEFMQLYCPRHGPAPGLGSNTRKPEPVL